MACDPQVLKQVPLFALRGELDFDVNRRAESEIQNLAGKLHLLDEKIGDIQDLLRERLAS
jgi:CRP/FNR family cyclic AMP-dependent transcriptional regulator